MFSQRATGRPWKPWSAGADAAGRPGFLFAGVHRLRLRSSYDHHHCHRRGVGPLLRAWREQRRVSQLELALRADSSARHISFIETGRSRPSEEMVLRLAEHLDVPVRERNALLLAAGYAPHYPETPLDAPALDALRDGIERLIQGYEPYPALVLDAMYNVVAANHGILTLLDGIPETLLEPPLNAMRLTLHPEGMAPRIRNLRAWRGHLLEQMERQIALRRSERCGRCTRRWRRIRSPTRTRTAAKSWRRRRTSRSRCGSSTRAGCCRSSRPSPPSTPPWT